MTIEGPTNRMSMAEIAEHSTRILVAYHALIRIALLSTPAYGQDKIEHLYPRAMEVALYGMLNDGMHNLHYLARQRTAGPEEIFAAATEPDQLKMLRAFMRNELTWLYDRMAVARYPVWWRDALYDVTNQWRALADLIAAPIGRTPAYSDVYVPSEPFEVVHYQKWLRSGWDRGYLRTSLVSRLLRCVALLRPPF